MEKTSIAVVNSCARLWHTVLVHVFRKFYDIIQTLLRNDKVYFDTLGFEFERIVVLDVPSIDHNSS